MEQVSRFVRSHRLSFRSVAALILHFFSASSHSSEQCFMAQYIEYSQITYVMMIFSIWWTLCAPQNQNKYGAVLVIEQFVLLATRLFMTSCIYSFIFRLLSIDLYFLQTVSDVNVFFHARSLLLLLLLLWKSLYLNDGEKVRLCLRGHSIQNGRCSEAFYIH